jgi:hypothetical protein
MCSTGQETVSNKNTASGKSDSRDFLINFQAASQL